MITLKEANKKYMGQEGIYEVGSLEIRVMVNDVKSCFGRFDILITPIAGTGEQWVSTSSVRFAKKGDK